MKFSVTIILIFLYSLIYAQSVEYSVECITNDSCFLKEVSTGATSKDEPRAQSTTSYRLFRSLEEYDKIVSGIRQQAGEELKKSMEAATKANQMVSEANNMNARANAMNQLADKIQAVRPNKNADRAAKD